MPRKAPPRIRAVEATDRPLTVLLQWSHGDRTEIDLSSIIGAYKVYAPLRDAPDLFRQVKVGEHGTDIVWSDEIDMANETLWRLARGAARLDGERRSVSGLA